MSLRAILLALPMAALFLPAVAQADSFLAQTLRAAEPVAAAPTVASGSSASTGVMGFGAALNAFRAEHGLGGLRESAALTRAAQAFAEDMARHGYFSHQGRDGSSVTTRVRAAGCRGQGYFAENIAWGQPSAQAAFSGWAARSGHRANMLGRNYGVYGLGQSNGYWVLTFADAC